MKRTTTILLLVLTCTTLSSAQMQLINERQITLLEKMRRPSDPWPRGDGHVLIGEPGSPVSQKGYHEPGGSFTPSPGSFGISFWIMDQSDKLIATSDDIPIEKITQRYIHQGDAKIPSLEDQTPWYSCTWTYKAAGQWTLAFEDKADNYTVVLVVRSVGPAGGPLKRVIWDKTRLILDEQWILTPDRSPVSIVAGDETAGDLTRSTADAAMPKEFASSASGWCYAKLGFSASFTVQLVKTTPQFASALSYAKTIPQFSFDLPDKNFEASLRAQVSTLMMGYVGRQTGPGEPINYPLAWERDGAYSLMAMAKSGQLQTAKELSLYFAENDFFGGFGSEGDAPGSAINALIEVAGLINDPAYDQWLWPHIERKLGYIDEMLNAKTEVYKNFIGPLAPHIAHDLKRRQLICKPFTDGLIVGTMDNHFPVLYINALSYRALIQASRFASKLNKKAVAADCLTKAQAIKPAWLAAFGKPKYDNERNFMISIWPSWIIDKTNAVFKEKIEGQRRELWTVEGTPKSRPLWTYFTVSEAHQWLFMERLDRTWETIHYFWNNQCAPGLYTYWEGEGEENTFRQWEHYRGWLHPRYVTPHYWTASEMTHLQLDMMVYIDESREEFEFVIGGGVPEAWLKSPMSVKNYRTKAGIVSWEYKNNVLSVTVSGSPKKYKVRPGPSFVKSNTKLSVSYK